MADECDDAAPVVDSTAPVKPPVLQFRREGGVHAGHLDGVEMAFQHHGFATGPSFDGCHDIRAVWENRLQPGRDTGLREPGESR
jgi:hypothetical protein